MTSVAFKRPTSGGRGPQGPQGPQGGGSGGGGSQGAQGAQGASGAQGSQGAGGAQGSQGTSGSQGTAGSQGSVGSQGSSGAQGFQGSAGAQGFQGTAGSQGSQGFQGSSGAQTPWTTNVDAASHTLTGLSGLAIGESSLANGGQFEIIETRTFTSGSTQLGFFMGGTAAFTTTGPGAYQLLTANTIITANQAMTSVIGLAFAPSVTMTTNALTLFQAVLAQPTLQKVTGGSFTTVRSFESNPNPFSVTVGTYAHYYVNAAGTAPTLGIGFQVGVLTGATKWGFLDSTLNNSSLGATSFGTNTAPTWNAHVMGGNSAKTSLGIDISTTAPTVPGSSAAGTISIYKGSGGTNVYFLVGYNDAGTTRYRSFLISGTTATLTAGTALPT